MDFKVQLAKGNKDAQEDVAWAIGKCKAPMMEPKYDGWRAIAIVEPNGVRIFNRSQKEYTGQVPEIEAELAKLPMGTILDGELVSLRQEASGRYVNNWSTVQTTMTTDTSGKKAKLQQHTRQGVQFVAFDILALGDNKHHARPLRERRDALIMALEVYGLDRRLVVATVQVEATQEAHDALVQAGFEGSVVKCQESPYGFGKRGHGWFKLKATSTIDVVVMELPVDGKGQFEGQVGRMVCGQMVGGTLEFVCKVNAPNNTERLAMTNRPQDFLGRIAEVKIYGWEEDQGPRHPTFQRWREDKLPTDCVLDRQAV